MNIDKHADKVVAGFKASLTKEQRKVIGSESFEELQMLVEAALGETASKAFHSTAKALEKLAKVTRKRGNTIDGLEE